MGRSRKMEVCHEIGGVDCIVTCNVSSEEVEVLSVREDDGKAQAPVGVERWPADLGEQIHVKALEQSAEEDDGGFWDAADHAYDAARDDQMEMERVRRERDRI